MRLGCLGYLTLVVIVILALVCGIAWVAMRALQEPEVSIAEATAAVGARAQR